MYEIEIQVIIHSIAHVDLMNVSQRQVLHMDAHVSDLKRADLV